MIGTAIGPYRLVELLGAGGMGEVYRARDERLHRDVAIKLVPEELAGDDQRMARFEREAQFLAALNHPNIAAIYGIEEAGSQCALVLELVEGETLAECLSRGPIEPRAALELAIQIAEALESAHAGNIVHRDLKPGNVIVTAGGKAKVLDFGLARALEGEPRDASSNAAATASPTLSLAATREGLILGTAGYMAPEQARGQVADQRADIWAFGVILYEMLVGARLFSADTVPDTLARVLTSEPDWDRVDALPRSLQRVLRRCLRKDAKRRYRDIGDVRLDLEELLEGWEEAVREARSSAAPAPAEGTGPGRSGVSSGVVIACSAAALALGALGAWWLSRPELPEPPPRTTFAIPYPDGFRLPDSTHPVAISPDGVQIVHLMIRGETRFLQVRPLDVLQGRKLGTEEAVQGFPFFSADGRQVYFLDRAGGLRRRTLSGEPPVTIVPELSSFAGGAVLEDGSVVYSDESRLLRVPVGGGEPRPIPRSEGLAWPARLPGSRAVLAVRGREEGEIVALFLEEGGASGEPAVVVESGESPTYAPSGHVVFARGGFLFAVRFDARTLLATGEPKPVLEGVYNPTVGAVHYALSDAGTLVYVPGDSRGAVTTSLVWVDRTGATTQIAERSGTYPNARLSPDGRRVALEDGDRIFVVDVEREGSSRLLTTDGSGVFPVWSRDGEWVYYSTSPDYDIYRRRADSSGGAELVLERPGAQRVADVAADGKRLLIVESQGGEGDIYQLTLSDDPSEPPTLAPVVATRAREDGGRFSPDGRLVAYVGNDAGRPDVYVVDLESGRREIASSGLGVEPVWSPDGKWLAYRLPGVGVLAVDVVASPELRLGAPRELFALDGRHDLVDLDPGGERFLVVSLRNEGDEVARAIRVVLHWGDRLAELVP